MIKWAVRAARVIVGGMGRLGGLGEVRRVRLVGVVKGNRFLGMRL